jgi:aryl-alcohol dehydrogenase-like predicted oxidoreductase
VTVNVELALGTVQFGTEYGIAGRGERVPGNEVREILASAWDLGIRVLDTAPGYGDIEQRLGDLAGSLPFRIVSKIPALPAGVDAAAASEFVTRSIKCSQDRLGERLDAILFHKGEDLLGEQGATAWRAGSELAARAGLHLGASFYEPQVARAAHEKHSLRIAQLPGNALDQRLASDAATGLRNVEIHLRSVFLQGLLLMPVELATKRLPRAAAAVSAWARWCTDRGISPLRAAFGAAKSLPGVRYCLIGIDSLAQLHESVAAWRESEPLDVGSLANNDLDVIDPRRWKAS